MKAIDWVLKHSVGVAVGAVLAGCLGIYLHSARHNLYGTRVVGEVRDTRLLFYLAAPTDSVLLAADTPGAPSFSIWSPRAGSRDEVNLSSDLRERIANGPGFLPDAAAWIDDRRVQVPACIGPATEGVAVEPIPPWREASVGSCWEWFIFDLGSEPPSVEVQSDPVAEAPDPVISAGVLWGTDAEASKVREAGLHFTGRGWQVSLVDEEQGKALTTHWVPLVDGLRAYEVALSPDSATLAYALGGMRGFAWARAFAVRRVDGRRWRLVVPEDTAQALQWHPRRPRRLYGKYGGALYVWTIPSR